ncbi:MAG TPA: phytanoyl-CoA dioxygenase family protein, partial [Epsilonproteobacteria bacterium]|nr:phytanoyl-CoA dioxygenase family protein [Campylobacterota bacterium]
HILKVAQQHLQEQIAPYESESEYSGQTGTPLTLRRLRQVYDRDPAFSEWMQEPSIRPILKQLLHDDLVITLAHHNSIMTKMPDTSTQTHWHQDKRYWHFENDNLISVWLALDSETLHNGALSFIPGSHQMSWSADAFDEKEYFIGANDADKKLMERAVSFDLQRGDVVLFHCKTLHQANANQTQKPKISFVYTVRAEHNHPIKGTRSDFKEVPLS